MIVAAIQMHSSPDVERNLAVAHGLMRQAVEERGADWLLLPEHFQWAGGAVSDRRLSAEVLGDGPAYRLCQMFARENRVFVHAGSIYEQISGDDRIYNTSVAFGRSGQVLATYRKAHLFDITAPDGLRYGESEAVRPGEDIAVYQADGITVGCAICYDLRFPDLFQALVQRGAQLIALPAAFTAQTGRDHWEPLIRARAIETQAYIVAAGSVGANEHAGVVRRTHGHSMLVDPWGRVVQSLSDGDGIVSCKFDAELVGQVRSDIPLELHRRQDLYRQWRT